MRKSMPLPIQNSLKHNMFRRVAWLLPCLVLVANASAQSVWDGGGANDNWNTADNWAGNVAPVASGTTDLQFDGTTRLSATNNYTTNLTAVFRSITFNADAGAFTLSGNTIGTTNSAVAYAITNNSSKTQTFNINLAYSVGGGSGLTLNSNVAGGALLFGGNIAGGSANNAFTLGLNNTSGISSIRLSGSNSALSNTGLNSGNHVNVVEVNSNSAFSGLVRARGAQLTAFGGDRTILRAIDLGGVAVNAAFVGATIAGENAFTITNGVFLAALTGGPFQSTMMFNTGATTTLAGGITATATNSSTDRIVNLAGSGSVLLSGNMVDGVNGIKNAFAWNNSQTLTISGNITSTGLSSLAGGQVVLDYGTNDTSKLPGGVLTLGGSKITLQGAGSTHVETVASTTLSQGATTVARTSGSATLSLGAMTRAAGNGATLAVSLDGLVNTTTANANGILGGYVLVGNNWGFNSANVITGLTSYQTDINDISSTTQNLGLTGTGALTANRTQNSLKILSSGTGESLDIGSGQSLSLSSGGLLFAGTNDYSISNGTLGVGAAAASNNDLKIFVTDAGKLTIGSVIASGTGANGLTKAGTGTLILTGSNTYTGTTYVNRGTLSIGAGNVLGSGTNLVINGGTLEATETFSLAKSGGIALGVDGGTLSVASGKTLTLSNNLVNGLATYTDTTLGSLTKSGDGTLVTTASNTYTGATVLNAGVLSVSSIKDGAEFYSGTYGAGGSAASGIGASTSSYRNLVLNGGTLLYTGTATSSNRDFTIGANGGTLDASGSGALNMTGSQIFLSGSNTARSLTLAGSNTGTNTLTGALADNGTGQTSLVKTGNGQWVLTAANTYSGTTTVSAGTLLISNTAGSGAGTGNVVVNGGKIGGSGAFTGALAINAGGTLSPGSSIETLGSGTLTFNTGSAFEYEVNSSVATSVGADLQKVTGGLNLSGTVTLTLADIANTPAAFAQTTTIFTLINYSGAWNNGLFTFGGNAIADGGIFTAGLNIWQLDYNATTGGLNFSGEYAGANFVNITAVPEPSTWALLGIALMTTMFFRRRRTH